MSVLKTLKAGSKVQVDHSDSRKWQPAVVVSVNQKARCVECRLDVWGPNAGTMWFDEAEVRLPKK